MGNKYSTELPVYTLEQVRESDRMLYILGNKVIDASAVLNKHPGGNDCLYNKKGTDITSDYKFHNPVAQKHIRELVVGIVIRPKHIYN